MEWEIVHQAPGKQAWIWLPTRLVWISTMRRRTGKKWAARDARKDRIHAKGARGAHTNWMWMGVFRDAILRGEIGRYDDVRFFTGY
jgi:hypothetical protein